MKAVNHLFGVKFKLSWKELQHLTNSGFTSKEIREVTRTGVMPALPTIHHEGVGFVYFVQEKGTGRIKIGKAKDPLSRMRTLQTGNQEKLQIIALFPDMGDTEAKMHEKFAKHRLNGEWFAGEPLRAWLARVV